jgi:MoaA/NifB/PqqE/SkfB family radical SAM enzyme
MIKTTAIKHVNTGTFSVVWDIGRRCNYDCSYCGTSRHNTSSPHANLETLKASYDFIKQYADIYNQHRVAEIETHINFTGGEPTANPNFWKLLDYIKSQPEPSHLGLTTNGAWSNKFSANVIKNLEWVTVSYHAEAAPILRQQVIKNILTLHESSTRVNVNMMMHVDHWDDCVATYTMLKEAGVEVRLRPIGDGTITIKGWFSDTDGAMRRTSHEYTSEQQAWYFNELGIKTTINAAAQGTEMGRACCGGICLKGKVNDEWQTIKLIDTNFKDWYCSVNWFFLNINQDSGEVTHHQTCNALFDGTRGVIGNLNNVDEIYEYARSNLDKTIVCPNPKCGCGMCAPKSQSLDDYMIIRQSIAK